MDSDTKQPSIWGLIVYILKFIFRSKKNKQENQDKVNAKLKQKYTDLDKEKEQKKKQDVKDRINNLF